MKSLKELLSYYDGVQMGNYATSERKFGSGHGRVKMIDSERLIDSALLYDADRLTKASLASFLACSRLMSGGYSTWGRISLYYAQFFSISSMLRLVGISPIGKWLLLRVDEDHRRYIRIEKRDSVARSIGCGGGSHKEIWRMFSRYFQEWEGEEPPGSIASLLSEKPISIGGTAWYETQVDERNRANYLQSNAGVFFPETDFSGLQGFTIDGAKLLGNWDWLRTDASPYPDEPPEAWFHDEVLCWKLIEYIIMALAKLQGRHLLDQYIWLIENLDAYDELRQHMSTDLNRILSDE